MSEKIKILSSIILYQKTLKFSESYLTLLKAIEFYKKSTVENILEVSLVIFDNSFKIQNLDGENFRYFHYPHNPGLSYCYNKLISLAEGERADYLNFFDQDTSLPEDYFVKIEEVLLISHFELMAPVVIQRSSYILISPYKDFYGKGFHLKFGSVQKGLLSLKDKSLINSGLVIKREVFRTCGLYNPLLPLDLSDNYLIREYRKHFNNIYLLPVEIYHSLSALEKEDIESTVKRFRIYLKAILNYKQTVQENCVLSFFALLRSCKLSICFKSIIFLKIYFSYFFKGKL